VMSTRRDRRREPGLGMAGMLARVISLGPSGEDGAMQARVPSELLDQIRALPAGGPLMAAVAGLPDVYLVGGAVRDLLRGETPFDLDLVVEGDPVQVARRIGETVVIHDRFGTTTVAGNGFTYDIARSRRESYSHPGALPDVAPADLTVDLARRDFTVNAIAVALGGAEAGALAAFPGALEDLRSETLRVLHDRSFSDDPTRLLRLARYHGRLGFSIEPHTGHLAADAVRRGALATVSGPRVGSELRLLASEADPIAALVALRELELDRAIHPRFGLEDDGLARAALALLPSDGKPGRLGLAAAAFDVPGAELSPLLDRLGFEAEDRGVIVSAATRAGELSTALAASHQASEIAAAASGATPEAVALAGALGAEAPARRWLDELRRVKLEITGGDLLAAGVPEGAAVGRGLRAALAAKLDGRADGREAELEAALRSLQDGG
jgi:tRNA nucleotidyltransferase (CCA-adding enzyme)